MRNAATTRAAMRDRLTHCDDDVLAAICDCLSLEDVAVLRCCSRNLRRRIPRCVRTMLDRFDSREQLKSVAAAWRPGTLTCIELEPRPLGKSVNALAPHMRFIEELELSEEYHREDFDFYMNDDGTLQRSPLLALVERGMPRLQRFWHLPSHWVNRTFLSCLPKLSSVRMVGAVAPDLEVVAELAPDLTELWVDVGDNLGNPFDEDDGDPGLNASAVARMTKLQSLTFRMDGELKLPPSLAALPLLTRLEVGRLLRHEKDQIQTDFRLPTGLGSLLELDLVLSSLELPRGCVEGLSSLTSFRLVLHQGKEEGQRHLLPEEPGPADVPFVLPRVKHMYLELEHSNLSFDGSLAYMPCLSHLFLSVKEAWLDDLGWLQELGSLESLQHLRVGAEHTPSVPLPCSQLTHLRELELGYDCAPLPWLDQLSCLTHLRRLLVRFEGRMSPPVDEALEAGPDAKSLGSVEGFKGEDADGAQDGPPDSRTDAERLFCALQHLTNLVSLRLFTRRGVWALSGCLPQLTELVLVGFEELHEDKWTDQMPRLVNIQLQGVYAAELRAPGRVTGGGEGGAKLRLLQHVETVDVSSRWDFPPGRVLARVHEAWFMLPSLRRLCLESLPDLEALPELPSKTTSAPMPSSLQVLSVAGCSQLRRLPQSFTMLTSLQELNVARASALAALPEGLPARLKVVRNGSYGLSFGVHGVFEDFAYD